MFDAPRQLGRFDLTLQHVVVRLIRGERADGMKLGELFATRVGKPDAANLACVKQLLHRGGGLRQRRLRVGSVEIEEVDPVGVQTGQAFVALPE